MIPRDSYISPTPAGVGKTNDFVGLVDALAANGKSRYRLRNLHWTCLWYQGRSCWRWSRQVVPMEDINLHFTGDFHAIGVANNSAGSPH